MDKKGRSLLSAPTLDTLLDYDDEDYGWGRVAGGWLHGRRAAGSGGVLHASRSRGRPGCIQGAPSRCNSPHNPPPRPHPGPSFREEAFEAALFAEMFAEMLQQRFGRALLRALTALAPKLRQAASGATADEAGKVGAAPGSASRKRERDVWMEPAASQDAAVAGAEVEDAGTAGAEGADQGGGKRQKTEGQPGGLSWAGRGRSIDPVAEGGRDDGAWGLSSSAAILTREDRLTWRRPLLVAAQAIWHADAVCMHAPRRRGSRDGPHRQAGEPADGVPFL